MLNLQFKTNHFPGSFQIGRKDRLCRNLYHAQSRSGKAEYSFIPVTYVLPADYVFLKNDIENPANKNMKWILKPVRLNIIGLYLYVPFVFFDFALFGKKIAGKCTWSRHTSYWQA
jgi:hypothetical protein